MGIPASEAQPPTLAINTPGQSEDKSCRTKDADIQKPKDYALLNHPNIQRPENFGKPTPKMMNQNAASSDMLILASQ